MHPQPFNYSGPDSKLDMVRNCNTSTSLYIYLIGTQSSMVTYKQLSITAMTVVYALPDLSKSSLNFLLILTRKGGQREREGWCSRPLRPRLSLPASARLPRVLRLLSRRQEKWERTSQMLYSEYKSNDNNQWHARSCSGKKLLNWDFSVALCAHLYILTTVLFT